MIVKNYNHNLEQTAAQITKRNREEQTEDKRKRRAAMVAIEQREERKRFDSDYTLQSGE
jgi:hypothetical protein|tara:strand:+ start:1251 stop:1427 length:177 start_codon:yes stop_codon:yes gene_type:complete